GSGLNGRVTRDDILKATAARKAGPTPAASQAVAAGVAPAAKTGPVAFRAAAMEGDTIVPFSVARQKTADHMVYS
ncbi:hypothetical protein, partial [Stenotrophomonas maltophilia]|uniref:hypothetical protein n=1 Tax=Stenotrophomonas maltophilia TaxID=40324 RepID=UPI001EF7E0E0